MSRKLTAILYAALVLVGAMGLKTLVAKHTDGSVVVSIGGAPVPPAPAD